MSQLLCRASRRTCGKDELLVMPSHDVRSDVVVGRRKKRAIGASRRREEQVSGLELV